MIYSCIGSSETTREPPLHFKLFSYKRLVHRPLVQKDSLIKAYANNKSFTDQKLTLKKTSLFCKVSTELEIFPSSQSLHFDDFIENHQPDQKRNTPFDSHFFEWFVGMAEGDGTFTMRIENGRPRFLFQIGQKDPKLLFKIKNILGFGRVSSWVCSKNKNRYWHYSVEDKRGLQRIIAIFNGNIVLPKRRAQFKIWFFQAKNVLFDETLFCYNSPQVTVSLNHAWLSGFLEAEGCFYANFTTPSQRSNLSYRLIQKIQITQQDTHGERQILNEIKALCQANGNLSLAKNPDSYRLEMSSKISHTILVNYLSRFPFQGNKKIAFKRWWRVYLFRMNNEHLLEKRIGNIRKLCLRINKNENV